MWKLSYGNGRKSIQVDVSGFCLPRNVCCDYMVGMPKLGPYSKSATLAKLDRRTKEARLLQSLRRELVAHVGGFPSTTQMLLIDQSVRAATPVGVDGQGCRQDRRHDRT